MINHWIWGHSIFIFKHCNFWWWTSCRSSNYLIYPLFWNVKRKTSWHNLKNVSDPDMILKKWKHKKRFPHQWDAKSILPEHLNLKRDNIICLKIRTEMPTNFPNYSDLRAHKHNGCYLFGSHMQELIIWWLTLQHIPISNCLALAVICFSITFIMLFLLSSTFLCAAASSVLPMVTFALSPCPHCHDLLASSARFTTQFRNNHPRYQTHLVAVPMAFDTNVLDASVSSFSFGTTNSSETMATTMTGKMLNLIWFPLWCFVCQKSHRPNFRAKKQWEMTQCRPIQADESSANQEERQPHHPHTIIAWSSWRRRYWLQFLDMSDLFRHAFSLRRSMRNCVGCFVIGRHSENVKFIGNVGVACWVLHCKSNHFFKFQVFQYHPINRSLPLPPGICDELLSHTTKTLVIA